MKSHLKFAVLALLSAFSLQPSALLGQGSLRPPGSPAAQLRAEEIRFAHGRGPLTPPGPPEPTMKTLDQIEPRTPISSAPYKITLSGSYYLTTNLTVSSGDAITIATNGVTLDLNGFTISSTEARPTGTGILLNSGLRNITIANGFIQGGVTNDGTGVYSGPGFANGIELNRDPSSPPAENLRVSGVSVSGCWFEGIHLWGYSTVVESCTVRTASVVGIVAPVVKQSAATDCGYETAIAGVLVSDCKGQASSGDGISAGGTAQNCEGVSTSGYGVYAQIAQNCKGTSSDGAGLFASTAENCIGESDAHYGLDALTAQNCRGYSTGDYDGLYARDAAENCYGYSLSGTGLDASTTQNCQGYSFGSRYGLYARNTAQNCYGYSYSGIGLYAYIASVCRGETTLGTALSATHNVNSY